MADASYYGRIADHYESSRWMPPEIAVRISQSIARRVGIPRSHRMLFLGEGTGLIAYPWVVRGNMVTVVDKSAPMLERFRLKFAALPPNLQLVEDDLALFACDPASADTVLSANVLHAIADRARLLSRIATWLTPEGSYLDCTWETPPSRRRIEVAFRRLLAGDELISQLEDADLAGTAEPDHHAAARQLGFAAESFVAHEWTVDEPLRALLDAYRSRSFGFCWLYTESHFLEVLDRFEAQCMARFGSLEHRLVSRATFQVVRWRR